MQRKVYASIWFSLIALLFVLTIYFFYRESKIGMYYGYKYESGSYVPLDTSEEAQAFESNFQVELFRISGVNRETTISSNLGFSLSNITFKQNQIVYFTVSSPIGYAPSEYHSQEFQLGKKFYSDMIENVELFPISGSNSQFPLEKLKFSVNVVPNPNIIFKRLDFYNRTDALIFRDRPNISYNNNKISLEFTLTRRIFDKILFIVLGAVCALFVILFLFCIKKKTDLTLYVSGFFISLWTIRGIFAYGVKTFPTYLDWGTLSLCIILLIGIMSKIILGKYED